ncbi:MAG TPA: UDP-glucose/GDP-mannose dehydrogenase family protein [Planctomycetota bacterium]|nr:UDP-glucose/GDP-mannose dehydrogenase family protein [Planctomycetota bacterium]
MRIAIVGTGYVGLVAGTCFAETGNDVIGLDVDAAKVARLSKGEIPIFEPGLSDLFARNLREGRLKFTTSYDEAVKHAETFFLCLPTPPAEDGSADTRYVLSAVAEIAKRMTGYKLLVSKSTVPIGTNKEITDEVKKHYKGEFSVAANPEFLKEGTAVEDFLKPDRVVVGVTDNRAFETLSALYDPFVRTGAPILRMDPASAELTKYAANGFLATKISFMNEVARLCEKTGADVDLVRIGMSKDARIGSAFLFPGIGYGGSCFPKDTRALVQSGRKCDVEMSIVDSAERVNETQKLILLPRIKAHFGGNLAGKTIALWGLAFKPRTDDIREAPALALIEKLLAEKAKVQAFDPEAMPNVKRVFGDKITFAKSSYEAINGADALVLATEWNEFRMPDWERVKKSLRAPVIFDGRNIYQPQFLRQNGFTYYGIGKP